MARTAQIDSTNTVVNVIEAPNGFTIPGYTLVQSTVAQITDTYNPGDGSFTHHPAPPDQTAANASAKRSYAANLRAQADALSKKGKTAEAMNLYLKAQRIDLNV